MFALLRALQSTLRPDVEAGGGREGCRGQYTDIE